MAAWLEPRIGSALKELAASVDDQTGYARQVRQLLRQLDFQVGADEEQPETDDDDSDEKSSSPRTAWISHRVRVSRSIFATR